MNTLTKERIYTVSEITKDVKLILESSLSAVWIEGEVSNFTLHSSGHMYFSLKDKKSVLRCVMFHRANEILKFEPKAGMQVVCFGSLSVYLATARALPVKFAVSSEATGCPSSRIRNLRMSSR